MRRIWTDSERQVMTEMFPDHYTAELSVKLNRSYRSVCSQASLMQLKKSSEFMNKELAIQADRLRKVGINNRFVKGQESPTKGKKMSLEVYEKVKHTMFKPGNKTHNAYPADGVITIRKDSKGHPYKYIRVSLGKWQLLHQYNYEKKHGKVPQGHCLWFKDSDSTNCEPENVELITRAENAKRNRQKYIELPEEIKSTMKIINKINLKVKRHEYKKQTSRP